MSETSNLGIPYLEVGQSGKELTYNQAMDIIDAALPAALTIPLPVAQGGTGATTLTDGGLLVGNGTAAIAALSVGAAGRVLTGTGADPAFSATPTLGVTGATLGTLALAGNTSGTVTVQPQAAAGTYNFNLPTGAGTAGQPLLSGGGGSTAQSYGTLSVGAGGTGLTSYTTGDIVHASGASTLAGLADVATGSVLVSGGVGVVPAWSASPTLTTSLTVPTIHGSASASGTLTLSSTSNGTKGKIFLGTVSAYDQVNTRLGIGTTAPENDLAFGGDATRFIAPDAPTTADTAGALLSLRGGRATTGSTNKAGGQLAMSAGTSTGSGVSVIRLYTYGITAAATSNNTQIRTQTAQAWSESGTDRAATLFDGMVQFNSHLVAYPTDVSVGATGRLYGTGSTGGAFPFTEAGHLIIQGRPDTARAILLVTGTSPAPRLVVAAGGNIGLGGVTAPTNILSFGGNAARIVWMERHTTADTAGNALTIQSGGATSGATDKAPGALLLATGLGTGNAVPGLVRLQGGGASATVGTTDQTLVDRYLANAFKVLTDGAATDILSCTLASGSAIGGVIHYTIEVTDGTDYQSETGYVFYSAVNKAGAVTRTITEAADSQQAVSAGTLTTTWAISNASPAVVSVNADTSLTPSTGYPRVTFSVKNLGQQPVAVA